MDVVEGTLFRNLGKLGAELRQGVILQQRCLVLSFRASFSVSFHYASEKSCPIMQGVPEEKVAGKFREQSPVFAVMRVALVTLFHLIRVFDIWHH